MQVSPHTFNMERSCISSVTLEIDFFNKKSGSPSEEFNSDVMAAEFTKSFGQLALTVGQQLVFSHIKTLAVIVTDIQGSDLRQASRYTAQCTRSVHRTQCTVQSTFM